MIMSFADSAILPLIIIALAIFGAIFGSFTACQVRRMRLKELADSHPSHSPSSNHSHNHNPSHSKPLPSRSICLHCHHQLTWYDNIPIFSWLILRGRCRYCHKEIGKMEIFSELGLAFVFVVIGLTFPTSTPAQPPYYAIPLFIIFLVTIVSLWTLLLYDAMWKRLPTRLLTFSIICAIIYRLVYLLPYLFNHNMVYSWIIRDLLLSLGGAIIILPGLYFILYKVSHERWVGSGDWLLCLALAFLLGDWWLALITLFLANFLGSIIMLPVLKSQKSKSKQHQAQNHRIAFGPFLILGFFLAYVCQGWLLSLI